MKNNKTWHQRATELKLLVDELELSCEPFRLSDLAKTIEPNKPIMWIYQANYEPLRKQFKRAQALQSLNGRLVTHAPKRYNLKPPETDAPRWIWKLYEIASADGTYKKIADRLRYNSSTLSSAVLFPNYRTKPMQQAIESLLDIPTIKR